MILILAALTLLTMSGPASAEDRFSPVAIAPSAGMLVYTQAMVDADLSSAREACFNHSEPTGHLLGCVPFDRMCNRTYTWPECWRIDELWQSTGAADRAAAAEKKADERAHEFVKGLAR